MLLRSAIFLLFVLNCLAFSKTAHATAIVYNNGLGLEAAFNGAPLTLSTQLNLGQFSVGNSNTTLNFGNGGSLRTLGSAQIVSGSSYGNYSAPYGATGPVTANYLAVEAYGAATLTLTNYANTVGFLWGSVNTAPGYDQVVLENVSSSGTSIVGSVDGSNIYNYFQPSGQQSNLGTAGQYGSAYVDLISAAAFNTVVFLDSTGANAFELAQIQVNTVPEPTALSLMLASMMLIFAMAWRARRLQYWQS